MELSQCDKEYLPKNQYLTLHLGFPDGSVVKNSQEM